MRNPEEREVALECARLACRYAHNWGDEIAFAEKLFAFVTGSDTDDAKAKLAAVREAVG